MLLFLFQINESMKKVPINFFLLDMDSKYMKEIFLNIKLHEENFI